ncbi:MAG: STAS domain-containing protein [Rhodobacterales bacterium]|nr:STAS domain-containing protein [Rhodobacterales bacterium]
MNHELLDRDGALVVVLSGDVDLDSSPEARRVLLDAVARGRRVLVDLAGVTYIDSSGVASLVESLQGARKAGTDLALVSVSEAALRVLQLARLDRVFTIHATLDEGLAAG